MQSNVLYYGDGKALMDEQNCLAVVYCGDMRYRVYYFPQTWHFDIKVDGTIFDASRDDLWVGRRL